MLRRILVPTNLRWLGAAPLALAIACCTPKAGAPSAAAIAANDRGVALMGQYQYAAAEEAFRQLAADQPQWLEARVNLAIATLNRQQEGDEQLALDLLAEVLEESPTHLRALYASAILHLYLGDAARAAGLLRQVVAADDQDAYAAYFLGQALLQQGDMAAASEWLLKSVELDPYLRSGYWAGAQALRRAGRSDEADRMLAEYQRFAVNPAARLAGFSYARMGPKATALAVAPERPALAAKKPEGSLFGAERRWPSPAASGSLTSADIDGDGIQDLAMTNPSGTTVLLGSEEGFASVEHPLAKVRAEALLWGDMDDDGLLDAVACSGDGVQVWRQEPAGSWAKAAALGATPCAAGAVFDADHDGDLDVFSTGPAGNELYSNDRDGGFRLLARDMGLQQGNGRQVLVADLDADRDVDVLVLNRTPPHAVWQNDRTWNYRPFPGLADFRQTPLAAVAAADADADGYRELYGLAPNGALWRWRYDGATWERQPLDAAADGESAAGELDVADFDGDGKVELLRVRQGGFDIVEPASGDARHRQRVDGLATALAVTQNPGDGPSLLGLDADGLILWPPGAGRHRFLELALSGRSEAEQMRSNASGIGTLVKVRAGGRWTMLDALDAHSGSGQSHRPLSVGLGGLPQADFIALEWSDGVTQTELELAVGERHAIVETQRQLASCPVFFVWDGRRYRFVSDVLGGAALGYLSAPGVYARPRPVEGYLLDAAMMAERDGRYHVKLSEPMEENAYLDSATLTAYDVPAPWSLALDERLATSAPLATGRAIHFRHEHLPVRVVDAAGEDVTSLAVAKDERAPPPGVRDQRFIGLLRRQQALTLTFAQALPADAVLLADAWIEFPYSQTVFAAWQAGLRYRPVTVEARAADGDWQPLAVEFGYPGGMPRAMALPLSDLPPGIRQLRLSSNMEIYWDRLRVVQEEPTDVRIATHPVAAARVARTGFARRSTGAQRLPHYDYGQRATYWDAKTPRGFYTALGDAAELVRENDGALAIIGSGEEIHLEFAAFPAPPPGHRRYYAIRFHGWAKDMDLYTRDGDTVMPLPAPERLDAAQLAVRDELHRRYNVRYQEGF